MTSLALRQAIITNPLVPDQEAAAFLAADEHWDGLAHYWRRLLPSNVYKVLEALLEHTRFNAKTWQSGTPPMPAHERLATLSGISVRTVGRILARDAAGRHTYTYRRCVFHRVSEASLTAYDAERARQAKADPDAKSWPPCGWRVGDLVAVKRDIAEQLHLDHCYELGDLIGLFIVGVEHRRRFDAQQRRWFQTSNAYHVRPIMPLPPTLEAEMAYGLHLTLVRRQREALTAEAPAIQAASAAPSVLRQPSCPPPSSVKLAEKLLSVSRTEFSREAISIAKRENLTETLADISDATSRIAPMAIRKADMVTLTPHRDGHPNHDETGKGDPQIGSDRVSSATSLAGSRHSVGQTSQPIAHLPEAAQRVAADIEAQRKRQAWHDRRTQIDAVIGADIQRAATLLEDATPGATRGVLVNAFANADTPLESLSAALRLIEHRYRRVYGAGGKPIATKAIATWISVARSVIAKGRAWAFDFAAQDTKEARDAQLKRDAKAATARKSTNYIQSPEYYRRLDDRSQSGGAIPSPSTNAPGRPNAIIRHRDDDRSSSTGAERSRH